jgi:hypothetical protein
MEILPAVVVLLHDSSYLQTDAHGETDCPAILGHFLAKRKDNILIKNVDGLENYWQYPILNY